MKLWKWWKKDEPEAEPAKEAPRLLEDQQQPEEPENNPSQPEGGINMGYRSVFRHIGWNDFKGVDQIPCFRQALLTGFSMGAVTGVVMYGVRRNGSKALNWAFAGFLGGSIISWEQCRFRIHQSKMNIRGAKEMYRRSKEARDREERANKDGSNKS